MSEVICIICCACYNWIKVNESTQFVTRSSLWIFGLSGRCGSGTESINPAEFVRWWLQLFQWLERSRGVSREANFINKPDERRTLRGRRFSSHANSKNFHQTFKNSEKLFVSLEMNHRSRGRCLPTVRVIMSPLVRLAKVQLFNQICENKLDSIHFMLLMKREKKSDWALHSMHNNPAHSSLVRVAVKNLPPTDDSRFHCEILSWHFATQPL